MPSPEVSGHRTWFTITAMSDGVTTTASGELIGLEDRAAWDGALEEVQHAFAHTWDHCHAIAASTRYATYLYRFRSSQARIVCPIAERPVGSYVDVVTPYGFSGFVGTGDCPRFDSHWREFAERRGYVCGYFILNPVMSNQTYFGDAAQPHRTLFVLDLRLDEEELFTRLSRTRRPQVRRLDADPAALVSDRGRLTEFFVHTYPEFMARRGAAGVYQLNERSLRELCGSPRVLLFGAQRSGRVRAVTVFGFTRYAADAVFHASLPGEESHSPMLFWAALRELKDRGVPSLNLGGGVTENDSLADFKRRFGAERVPLRNIKQVYRADVYRTLCRRAGVDPAGSSYFPAYRAPRSE